MTKTLISTIWENTASVFRCAHTLSVDKIILLVDKKVKKKQADSVNIIKERYSKILKLETVSIELFNVPKIVEECVNLIDKISKGEEIYVHINDGRRTQTIGLLLAAFRRCNKVKSLYYFLDEPDNTKSIELPKLSIRLSDSQTRLLEILSKNKEKYGTLKGLASRTKQSRPLLYKNIQELDEQGMIEKNDEYVITDAGRIAIL